MWANFALFLVPFFSGFFLSEKLSFSRDIRIGFWLSIAISPVLMTAIWKGFSKKKISSDEAPCLNLRLNKCLGLLVCWLGVCLFGSAAVLCGLDAASNFYSGLPYFFPLLLVFIPCYVLIAERFDSEPHDAYARLGSQVRGIAHFDWAHDQAFILSWIVKAFFIPIMYSSFIFMLYKLQGLGFWPKSTNWIDWLLNIGLAIDVMVAAIGYMFASRLLRTDVISVDSHWLSWLACLICYPPFNDFLHIFTTQTDSAIWTDWLAQDSPLYWFWAIMIVSSWIVYWSSTLAFGLRFSNLTYRGLIDFGPYRYSKHPSYISKNIYWWLYTVPFFGAANGIALLHNIAGMLCLSGVYLLRAKMEERYLRQFPEYVEYAKGVDERWRSIFSRLSALRNA